MEVISSEQRLKRLSRATVTLPEKLGLSTNCFLAIWGMTKSHTVRVICHLTMQGKSLPKRLWSEKYN